MNWNEICNKRDEHSNKQNWKGWCGVSSHIKNIDKVLISRRGQLGSIDGHDCVSCVTITKWERYNKIKH